MGQVSKQVEMLELMADKWAELYRVELETALGIPFSVGSLTHHKPLENIDDQFFDLSYDNRSFGIVLPFRKRAFCGYHCNYRRGEIEPDEETAVNSVKRVFEQRNYVVEHDRSGSWHLVERGRI